MIGRPKISEDDKKLTTIGIRVTRGDRNAFRSAAGGGRKMSKWIRATLFAAAGVISREKPEAPKKRDLSELRVSREVVNGALVKPTPMPMQQKPRPDRPAWWDQLERDAKNCPGKSLSD